jgi:predicted RND superfamily exporter protein
VGHLNTASGFLVSILAGQGVNVGIMFMSRYLQARRDEHVPVPEAIHIAHRDTGTATLAVAGSSMIAYGSLAATDFHGFKHFGVIAGAGMMLCWIATHLFLPTFLILSERLFPMYRSGAPAWRSKLRGFYGVPFAFLAKTLPRPVVVGGLLAGVASVVLAIGYFRNDPMEYDLGNVRNERTAPTSAGTLAVRVDKIVGRFGQDGRAILLDRVDQVAPLMAELERRREIAPAGAKPFDRVVSIFEFLPKDQPEKLVLLAEIQDRLKRAAKRGLISDSDMKEVREHLPEKLAAIELAHLPAELASPFTERDGTRGTIVYIVPTEGKSIYDARYLMRWADSFREVPLPSGEVVRGTGDPVIYSDMLINVGEDAPKAILLSLMGTLLVIMIAFRGRIHGWATFGILLLGVAWLIGFLALEGIKLNFLSFMALPITIGVGADYAINMMKRREITGAAELHPMLRETAGAVVLCSLTALVGYLALLLSINRAVQSFGLAAAAGEVATLLAAILVLPAFWFWRAKSTDRIAEPALANDSRAIEDDAA